MNVALTVNNKSTKDMRFYLDAAANVYITYNRSLFGKYSEVRIFPIWMFNNSNQRIWG